MAYAFHYILKIHTQPKGLRESGLLLKTYPSGWTTPFSVFSRAHPSVGQFSKIYRLTTRNTKFFNGDRYVYIKLNSDANTPISPRIRVGEYLCRVEYSSMNMVCERCISRGHHTKDTDKCPA